VFKDVLSNIVVVAVALPPPLSSGAVVVASSIDNEAAAVGITELKPRSDAATSRNEVKPARLIITLRDFIEKILGRILVKSFRLMLWYPGEKKTPSKFFAQVLE